MNNLIEKIGLQNIIIYFVAINVIGFLAMGLDKWKAKKGGWRIPEKSLFIITAIGGGIGTILGMYAFRHKTKKAYFTIGFPILLILDIVLIIALCIKN